MLKHFLLFLLTLVIIPYSFAGDAPKEWLDQHGQHQDLQVNQNQQNQPAQQVRHQPIWQAIFNRP